MQVLSGDLHRGRWDVSRTQMVSLLFERIPLTKIRQVENLGAGAARSNSGAVTGGNLGGAAGMLLGGVPGALLGGLVGGGIGGRQQAGVTCSITLADGRAALAAVTAAEYQLLQAAAFRHRATSTLKVETDVKTQTTRIHQQLAMIGFQTDRRISKQLFFRVFDDEISWETWDTEAHKTANWTIPLGSITQVEMRSSDEGPFIVITAYGTEYPFLLAKYMIDSVFKTIQTQLDGLRKEAEEERAEAESSASESAIDVTAQIRRLHELLTVGALTAQEFDSAKADLLRRL